MPIVLAASLKNAEILLALVIMLAAAKILAEVFERLRQPAVVGEILAGVIIGPSLLGWVEPSAIIEIIAEIGVIFLLFNVGLETKPQSILEVGTRAFMVAVLGVIIPFVAGYIIAIWWGGSAIEAMFIGAALVATSVGITARVLGAMGLLDAPTTRIILGAAVIDDILGLLILSVVSSFSQGSVNYLKLAGTAGLSILFTFFILIFGARLMKHLAPRITNLRVSKSLFNFGLILCLGLSFAAIFIGVAAIIGAFLAGMALADATEDDPKTRKLTRGVMEFLVPFFLVNIGMQFNPAIFRDFSAIGFAVVLTVAAVLAKFIGCSLGATGIGWRRASQVGVGMVPRGEVGIVVAQIGLGLAVISERFFTAVLFMAIATTLIAPPFIKIFFKGERELLDSSEDIHMSDVFSRIG
ncbi:MAG: cation:proton antiporter [Pyrinomonadaceae bacterium]